MENNYYLFGMKLAMVIFNQKVHKKTPNTLLSSE